MADALLAWPQHTATTAFFAAESEPPAYSSSPDPGNAIAITRTLQSAVLRLRWTLLAMKLAADGELENPQLERLFWPDLMDALLALTPDANALDEVVDKLRRV
ncbi:MAG: hypothetical protein KA795_01780 [Burkholderiaceae bacterium]|nr:hypothetical protein [Burkholderiaceae bacterium]